MALDRLLGQRGDRFGGMDFGGIESLAVNGAVGHDQFPLHRQRIDLRGNAFLCNGAPRAALQQQFACLTAELVLRQIQVPGVGCFIQCVQDGALDALRRVRLCMHPPRDLIRCLKAKAADAAERKRSFAHRFDSVRAESLADLRALAHADPKRRENADDLPQGPAVLIGFQDALQFAGRDAAHLQEFLRRLFQNAQGVKAKGIHQKARRLRADAFDEPAGQVAEDAGFGRRHDLAAGIDRQARTVTALLPVAVQFLLDGVCLRQKVPGGREMDLAVVVITVAGGGGNGFILRVITADAKTAAFVFEQSFVVDGDHNSTSRSRFVCMRKP